MAKTMIDRTMDRLDLYPEHLAADTAYGSSPMLGWLVDDKGIEPHIPVIDKAKRDDDTFERGDFTYDREQDVYICPEGKMLKRRQKQYKKPVPLVDRDGMIRYRASKLDCDVCPLKPKCCPKEPHRKILRSVHEGARDMAREIKETEEYQVTRRLRKKSLPRA